MISFVEKCFSCSKYLMENLHSHIDQAIHFCNHYIYFVLLGFEAASARKSSIGYQIWCGHRGGSIWSLWRKGHP